MSTVSIFIVGKLLYDVPFTKRFESLPPFPFSLSSSPLNESANPAISFTRSFLWDSLDLLFVIVYTIMSFQARGSLSLSLSLSLFLLSPFPFATVRWADCEIVFWLVPHSGSEIPVAGRETRASSMRGGSFLRTIIRRKPQPATFTSPHAQRRARFLLPSSCTKKVHM